MMPVVSLNGFQARTNHADDLVLAATNQVGQRRSYATLVVGDQDAHTDQAASWSTAVRSWPTSNGFGNMRWTSMRS